MTMYCLYDREHNIHSVSTRELQYGIVTINDDGTVNLPDNHVCGECIRTDSLK